MRAFVAACLVLAGLGACVIPIGPEWTDPAGNSPPTIHSANPPIGSVLGNNAVPGTPLMVEVTLADQNRRDDLYARWLVDYPPFVAAVSRMAYQTTQPGGTEVVRPLLSFAPSCGDDQIATGFSNHRLMLAASDRPFLGVDPVQPVLDAVADGNFVVRAVWEFNLTCP